MSDALEERISCTAADRKAPPRRGIFAAWRLEAYGYTLATFYIALLIFGYYHGLWLENGKGVPLFSDFTTSWLAGWQALHGQIAPVFDPADFVKLQKALVGPRAFYYPNWPYPPIYFLILAPLAAFGYATAFLAYETSTLLGCIIVVYLIVRQRPAIALVLAAPFTAWNFIFGQSGFLTAALIGAALLALERRPMLAGVLIGCLTYKPQFGILFPVALIAAGLWRTIASAAATMGLLAAISIAAFGAETWAKFPRELVAQAGSNLLAAGDAYWGLLQTPYGLVRRLHGGAELAWLAQGFASSGIAAIVWLVWRSPARFALKAAVLSAGIFIATPYAFAYDLSAVVVPVAFLAKDQIDWGLMRGEQTTLLALFIAGLSVFPTAGWAPVGVLMLLALLCLILRRALHHAERRTSDEHRHRTVRLLT